MNEFEWLKQTRALNRPVAPGRDLWPGIAARLDASTTPAKRHPARLLPWAMAAGLAVFSILAGTLAWQQQATQVPRLAMQAAPAAIKPWKPRDPRLVGAAIELNIARKQLARAIRQAPHEAYLQHMLAHTNQQIRRLQQLPYRAG